MKTLVMVLILFSTLELFAQNHEVTRFEVEAADHLSIKGYRGKVVLLGPSKGADTKNRKRVGSAQVEVRVHKKGSQEEWSCTVEKLDQEIRVEVRGPSTKEEWKEGKSSSHWPEYEIVVSGASLPTAMAWYDGDLTIEGWSGKVEVMGQRLRSYVRDSEGEFKIQTHQGSVKVERHEGPLTVTGFDPTVSLKSIGGPLLHVENFSGSTQIDVARGKVYLKSQKGRSTLKGVRGTLQVFNGEGPVVIRELDGAMDGESRQGSLDIELKRLSHLRIRTAEGGVRIKPPKDSGAKVNLGSHEGPLYVPRFLKVSSYANMKVAAGRLTGTQPGSIHVRTLKGKIQLR